MPDKIEVVSHPGPDSSITEEGLKTYRVFNRRYRNRRIGEFLKEMHLTEGRNTGFRKILNALDKNGSPKPLFEMDPERLSFYATLFIHPAFLENGPINDEKEESGPIESLNLDKTEITVLKCIYEHPNFSLTKVSSYLNLGRTTIVRAVSSLKKKELLQHVGARKNGQWVVAEEI